jgi:hypothetical protein
MISIPVAVHNDLFRWQLDLFWYNHKLTYGRDAYDKAHAVIIKRNTRHSEIFENCAWDTDIPHSMCEPYFDYYDTVDHQDNVPLNIQCGLAQIIDKFDDDQLIEVIDCDMFHFRPHPKLIVGNDQLVVCDIYENWHMYSLGQYKYLIEPYFKNNGAHYNGGFVPIIGRVRTFKKILKDWEFIHKHLLIRNDVTNDKNMGTSFKWWAGMYSLNAACERNAVQMVSEDSCFIPTRNNCEPQHYIGHYSVDYNYFCKRKFPSLDFSAFPDHLFYNRIQVWYEQWKGG